MSKENDKIRKELGFGLFPEREKKEELKREIDRAARNRAINNLQDFVERTKEVND